MKLIPWTSWFEPLGEMDRWVEEWSPSFAKGFVPALDIYQTKDVVVVETSLAGVDPKDVNIAIENDVLTIEGKLEKKSEVEEKDYYRKEVRKGSFHRTVALPVAVESDKAAAEYHNGVLKITIPKSERTKPKMVTIKTRSN